MLISTNANKSTKQADIMVKMWKQIIFLKLKKETCDLHSKMCIENIEKGNSVI